MRVLVIDDEPLVRLSFMRALRNSGHTVAEAEDGQSGLETWAEFKPDLVFLDVLMPRLSGPDLLRAITPEAKGPARVVLMSAFTGEYDLVKAQSLGADLFIPKPFDDIFALIRMGEDLTRDRG